MIGTAAFRYGFSPIVFFMIALALLPVRNAVAGADIKPEIVSQIGHSGVIGTMTTTADGRYLLTGSRDNSIKLWEVRSGRLLRTFVAHSRMLNAVAVTRDGRTLVSCADDKTIRIWDMRSGRLQHVIKTRNSVNSLVLTPDGKKIVAGDSQGIITVWRLRNRRKIRTIKAHKKPAGEEYPAYIGALGVMQSGPYVVSGGRYGNIRLWSMKTGRLIRSYKGQSSAVTSLALSRDDEFIASGGDDGRVRLWNLHSGKILHEIKGHTAKGYLENSKLAQELPATVYSIAITPDNRHIVSGSDDDETIKIWDLKTGGLQKAIETEERRSVRTFTLSPDGGEVITGGEGQVLDLRDLKTGKILHAFRQISSGVRSLALAPDGRHLV